MAMLVRVNEMKLWGDEAQEKYKTISLDVLAFNLFITLLSNTFRGQEQKVKGMRFDAFVQEETCSFRLSKKGSDESRVLWVPKTRSRGWEEYADRHRH